MKITAQNYYEIIDRIGRKNLHADLISAAQFVDDATDKGKDWSVSESDSSIRETIHLYFGKLEEYIAENKLLDKPASIVKTSAKKTPVAAPKTPSGGKLTRSPKTKMRVVARSGEPVERISDELRFIKRFTLLNGKVKTYDQVRSFLNSLQRAIAEKKIRKSSNYASQIKSIQDSLIELLQAIKPDGRLKVEIEPKRLAALQSVCGQQELMLSVRFIKSYIGLQGKVIENNRAKNLYNRVGRAINAARISAKDPYYPVLEDMLNTLESFVKKNPRSGVLMIPSRELNGLGEFINEGLDGVHSLAGIPDTQIVKGSELMQMEFETLGFRGKWLDFFGDPTRGFTIMVSALPKFGKSTFCIEFADYLSRNHGSVLYVCKEEQVGRTLKDKAGRAGGAQEVDFVGALPDNISDYDFVFLDSVTKLGLTIQDLDELRKMNPGVSFIFVFQTTKQGIFRGGNGFQHDVDMIVEFPEIGHAVQYGRYSSGGEMYIEVSR